MCVYLISQSVYSFIYYHFLVFFVCVQIACLYGDYSTQLLCRRPPPMGNNDDPNASLMGMLKNMYEDGDDEMKRSLQKAFYESQNKQDGGNLGM